MPGAQVTVRVDKRPLRALVRAMPNRTRLVVRRNAFAMADRAKSFAHVITGSMRDSVYVNMGGGDSTYTQAVSTAAADNPRARIVGEIQPEKSRASAVVGVAVEHGIYEEFRAGHRFLLPAAEAINPAFIRDAQTIIAPP